MSEWQKILEPFGALWQADELLGFQSESPGAGDLSALPMLHHRLIQVDGSNTETFLQGQLSCDIRRLANGEHLLGAHCNAKGRMVSSMQVFRESDQRVYLRVPADMAQEAIAALQKYAVFAKVKLAPADMLGLAMLGGDAKSTVTTAKDVVPGTAVFDASGWFLHHPGWTEYWGSEQQCQTLLTDGPYKLDKTEILTDLLIRKGIAEVRPATREEFIPQMFNFDLLDGVSFKKGCYTGQEIIARLHYRGQAKKRTFLFSCQNATVGAQAVDADQPEQTLGTVVAASRTHALVCLPVELYANPRRLQIMAKPDSVLEWMPQPYAIP